MPNYLTKALHKFQHPTPGHAQYAPHQWTRQNHCKAKQIAYHLDNLTTIPEEQKRKIQKIVVTLLYCFRAVDCTMLPALNTIAEQQSKPTQNTKSAIAQFLDYASTNPSAIFQYYSSNMILHVDSDVVYPSEQRALSRTGGHYYLSLLTADP